MSTPLPTGKCEICGATRPADGLRLFVLSEEVPGLWYCHDNPRCGAMAKTKAAVERARGPVDTANHSLVGLRDEKVVLVNGQQVMSRERALNLAAWIVALVDPDRHDLNRLVEEILKT